jgi:hypothetical protein
MNDKFKRIFMKIIYQAGIAAVACLLLLACNRTEEESKGEPLTISGSADRVVLLESNENDIAVTFTWNRGIERSATDTVTYIFRLDIADRDFATATSRDTVTDFTVSYTVAELNELIATQWQIRPGEEVDLEARVVANIRGEKFVYPEIAVFKFTVVTYAYASIPMFLVGSANPGDPIPLTETVNGREYVWRGNLNAGEFKFLYGADQAYSLVKGADESTLAEKNSETDPDNMFTVSKSGIHALYVYKKDLKIVHRHIPYYFPSLFLVGDATLGGWDPDKAPESSAWNDKNPGIYIWETLLTGDGDGEDSFKILTARDWGGYNIRPPEQWGSITNTDFQCYEGGSDLKWKVLPEESGNYRITLDISEMKIYFEKQ